MNTPVKQQVRMTIPEMIEFGVTVTSIARRLDCFPVYIYAFLRPERHPRVQLKGDLVQRIADLEGRDFRVVWDEYASRKEAAAKPVAAKRYRRIRRSRRKA